MNIVWSEYRWMLPAAVGFAAAVAVVLLGYAAGRGTPGPIRALAAGLKISGFALLFVFLLGPEAVQSVARPRANAFVVLVDSSASMQIRDQAGGQSRADRVRALLGGMWLDAVERQFDVQRFAFDARLLPVQGFEEIAFDGTRSSMVAALRQAAARTPVCAGIAVLTDGCATDLRGEAFSGAGLPPVYPIVIGPATKLSDLAVDAASVTTTVFEDAPVVVDASVRATGAARRSVTARLVALDGTVAAEEKRRATSNDELLGFRFTTRPAKAGPAFYRVEASLDDPAREATLENNHSVVATNRDAGPYRVLYVGGRPSWEHKFLLRALGDDPSIKMASLVRIAQREPKFDWRSRRGETTNPLYRGFGASEEVEQYDESVFLRLGTRDAAELRAGFPRTADELYEFEAIVLDDIEAEALTHDQQRLIERFVAERGGSLVMLGGSDSLDSGGYAGTPVGEALPVYLDRSGPPPNGALRFRLTREGILEPWMRLCTTEVAERKRIDAMPSFQIVHSPARPKPGAMAVAEFENASGERWPAVVVERYGDGRSAAVLMGDFWRWAMKDAQSHASFDKAWRQLFRWALSDVPRRASITVAPDPDAPDRARRVRVRVLGRDFRPAGRAVVQLRLEGPDRKSSAVDAHPDPEEEGVFTAEVAGAEAGPWLAEALVTDRKDGFTARVAVGWASNPSNDEFRRLEPDRKSLEAIARATNGSMPDTTRLEEWATALAHRPQPIMETRSAPLWHRAGWLALAIGLFVGEWGLRRWKGLP